MVDMKIGRIFTTILTSSTSFTVHCTIGWAGLFLNALLRNLISSVGFWLGTFSLTLPFPSSLLSFEQVGLEWTSVTALLEFLDLQVLKIAAVKTCRTGMREGYLAVVQFPWHQLCKLQCLIDRFSEFYLDDGGNRTSSGNFVPVKGRAKEKYWDGEQNCCSGNPKTPLPAFVVFNPDHESDGNKSSTR